MVSTRSMGGRAAPVAAAPSAADGSTAAATAAPHLRSRPRPSGPLSWLRVDGRHGQWAHPLGTMLALFAAIIGSTVLLHDALVARLPEYAYAKGGSMLELGAPALRFHPLLAYFFIAYVVVMITSRYLDCGSYIFYESVWCCNSALLMAGLGMLTARPLLVGACVAGVCCDQLMWYLDCLAYPLLGKFPVGVAKYLAWPETTWSKRYLCTHHLWFMPAVLWALHWHLPAYSFLLSCWFTSVSTGLCRYTTPKMWKDVYNGHEHYMNVNAGHEFWRDIKVPVLHMFNQRHPAIYLAFMFVCINTGLNGPPYLLLNALMELLRNS